MIVLDTHAWIWLESESETLSPAARRAVERAEEIGIPAVSCLEIAQLAKKNRLSLDREPRAWFELALSHDRVRLLPLTPDICVRAVQFGLEHGDPFDRVIVATAIAHRAPLVTKDDRIRRFEGVTTIW